MLTTDKDYGAATAELRVQFLFPVSPRGYAALGIEVEKDGVMPLFLQPLAYPGCEGIVCTAVRDKDGTHDYLPLGVIEKTTYHNQIGCGSFAMKVSMAIAPLFH
jgi:hypothetical protein